VLLGLVKFASRHTFIINPEGKVAKVFTEVNSTSIVRKCWPLSPNCKNKPGFKKLNPILLPVGPPST
jgi:hypothetical protein